MGVDTAAALTAASCGTAMLVEAVDRAAAGAALPPPSPPLPPPPVEEPPPAEGVAASNAAVELNAKLAISVAEGSESKTDGNLTASKLSAARTAVFDASN